MGRTCSSPHQVRPSSSHSSQPSSSCSLHGSSQAYSFRSSTSLASPSYSASSPAKKLPRQMAVKFSHHHLLEATSERPVRNTMRTIHPKKKVTKQLQLTTWNEIQHSPRPKT